MAPPNFVFIMTDSQGANDIGCYGRPELDTPNIDRLATQGIRFERAYTTCPVCTPARAGIFTGQYSHSSGPWANELPLAQTAKTMGQRFQRAGYRTAYVGKWHLSGQDYFDTGNCPDGWENEYWFDGRRYLSELTDDEVYNWRHVLTSTEALLKYDVPAEFTWGHRISDRAVQFLSETQEKPFVLALSYDEPHGPCTCPAEYVGKFENFEWDPGPNKHDTMAGKPALHGILKGKFRRSWELTADGNLFYPPFFGCNSFVDSEIGRVLEAVDRFAPDNTWVIFTSDHGQFKGAHGLMGKGLVMYEESARIPLIIRGPDQAASGLVDRSLVSHIDILPTMLELAGLPVYPILDGDSLAPHLLHGVRRPDKEVVIEWNRSDVDVNGGEGFYPVRCLLSGSRKLVINLLDTDELYDLDSDPHELNNRIQDPSLNGVRSRMHDRLMAWMNDKRDPFRSPAWLHRPWREPVPDVAAGVKPRPDDGYLPPVLDYRTGKPRDESEISPGPAVCLPGSTPNSHV